MRHGKPQELVGIYRSVIDADFIMQVWPRAATAQANIPNRVAAADVLSGDDRIACQVPVAGRDSMTVIEGDSPSVSAHKVGEHHNAICRSYHRLPVGSGYV